MATREELRRNKKDKEIRAQVSYYLAKENYTKRALAKELGMSEASLYSKLKCPEKFTFGEFRNLLNILDIADEKKLILV